MANVSQWPAKPLREIRVTSGYWNWLAARSPDSRLIPTPIDAQFGLQMGVESFLLQTAPIETTSIRELRAAPAATNYCWVRTGSRTFSLMIGRGMGAFYCLKRTARVLIVISGFY